MIMNMNMNMKSLHLEILLKLKIAKLFGKVPVNGKNNGKNKCNYVQYKDIIPDTKHHYNNLMGKIVCNNYDFYYVPLKFIENYEHNNIGISICSNIEICPFCSGIILDSESQYKYYKMMQNKKNIEIEIEIYTDTNIDTNIDTNTNTDTNLSIIISDEIYKLLNTNFCFEIVKNNKK